MPDSIKKVERFTLRQRRVIQSQCELFSGHGSISRIARILKRSVSSVRYEITVNSIDGVYDAKTAHTNAKSRRSTSRQRTLKVEQSPELQEFITSRLHEHWSPEQISHSIERYAFLGLESVSVPAIYRWLYRTSEQNNLTYFLRTKRCARKKHPRRRVTPKKRFACRSRMPGWETDTMMFYRSPFALSVDVNRVTKQIAIKKIRTEDIMEKAEALKRTFALHDVKRMAYDQRDENNSMFHFRRYFGVESELCHGPWDKPIVENTIRLLRDFFPFGEDVSRVSDLEIDLVAESLNNRPRKTLGWHTPNEASLVLPNAIQS